MSDISGINENVFPGNFSGDQLEERVREGTYLDAVAKGFTGTKAEFDSALALLSSLQLLQPHLENFSNPHKVTKAQVGLGNVVNESKTQLFESPNLTGTPTSTTPDTGDESFRIATTDFVQKAILAKLAANDAMLFKGTLGDPPAKYSTLPDEHTAGWTYKVVTEGFYAGQKCEIGDMITCIESGTIARNEDWTIYQTNIDGAVTGPTESTDNHIVIFDGITGKLIKDSGFTIGVSVPSNAKFTDTLYMNGTGLNLDTETNTFSVKYGTTEGTACQGNDSRLSDTRNLKDVLLDVSDLNNVKTPNIYYGAEGNTILNKPDSIDGFSLEVFKSSKTSVLQKLISGIGGGSQRKVFLRQFNGTEWSDWDSYYTSAYPQNSVPHSFAIKIGNGTTEGKDLYTFNGSVAKSLNIKGGSNVNLTTENGILTIGFTSTPYNLPKASTTALGGVMIGYATNGKNYAIQLDSEGKAFVNVPWTNTVYSLPAANTSALGGVKLGYTENSKNYAIKLDSDNKAYVTVPWTDTKYTLPTANSTALGGIKIGYTSANKNYAVQLDANGKAFVSVPWNDTVYSLPVASKDVRGGIQIGYSQNGKNYPIQLAGDKAYVNVPWTDTKYTLPEASTTVVGGVKYGTTEGTACQGNDSRLSNARTPTAHNQASSTINALTGYTISTTGGALAASDTLNVALGKLEFRVKATETELSGVSAAVTSLESAAQ